MHLHHAVTTGLAAALLLCVGACGGGDGDDGGETRATETATASSTPSPTTPAPATTPPTEVDADDLAGIVSGTPTDVTWRVPTVPSSWKQLPTEQGERQWQIRDTACVVTLSQPAGLGTEAEPTQDQVLDEFATRAGKAVGATLTVGSRGSTMLPLIASSKGVTASTRVSRATLAGGDGVQGVIYAYRSGDFALVMTALCGGGAYDSVAASDVRPFVEGLAVEAEY